MLVLFETPAGFALFKVLDEGKLNKVEDLWKEFQSTESARKVVKLKNFSKFENTAEALTAATLLIESKPSKGLRKFLRQECEGETLAVADSKLGNAIKEKLKIECVHNNAVMELMRGLRAQLSELVTGLGVQDLAPMSLGLSHSLSRFRLKFSPDKVDTMIIQAIGLLDDLDKELNTYAMRVREWYGWHFPELAKIVQDNIQYAKVVKLMGNRTNAANLDFSEILPEEVEAELKEAAVISMGTEISDHDMLNIKALCDQVISLSEYRGQLFDYLRSRMNAIAPNLTALVGELVGARLIAHAGSLLNLAKQPGSTVQILGAEKALFRALKTKHQTPKYGLIFHASLVGQAAPKLKGKISRSLAAKAALSIRIDALGENQDGSVGIENRAKLETRLRQLEGRALGRLAGSTKGKPKIEPYDKERKKDAQGLLTAAKTYNPAADSTIGQQQTQKVAEADQSLKQHDQKQKGDKKRKHEDMEQVAMSEEGIQEPEKKKKKKKEGSKREEATPQEEKTVEPEKKKRKKEEKKNEHGQQEEATPYQEETVEPEKKKRKKKAKNTQEGQEDATSNAFEHEEAGESEKKKKKKKRDLRRNSGTKSLSVPLQCRRPP
uniref:Nop domain-containing protein n=1 Tax=Araucaria cunninghamii TaxID=56994 RepID=A0A0D6QWI3_ARACU